MANILSLLWKHKWDRYGYPVSSDTTNKTHAKHKVLGMDNNTSVEVGDGEE